ncbi:MAG: DoxX family protein [Marinirhabdus sp.]|nr:DoxX family protein [Marinirhabdus sp.]
MKTIHRFLQITLGIVLLVFGLNKFFWFLTDFDFSGYPEAAHLFDALRYSGELSDVGKGYIMHMVGATEIVVGLLLVLKKWVPFALVMLVPISAHIVMFHLMLNLPNIIPALAVAGVNAYLIYVNWHSYKPMFSA